MASIWICSFISFYMHNQMLPQEKQANGEKVNFQRVSTRPLAHNILVNNSELEVYACRSAQAANQPHSGGLPECRGPWTQATGLPSTHKSTFQPTNADHRRIGDRFQEEEEVLTQRRRLVGGPGFGKMRVAQLAHTNPIPPDPIYTQPRLVLIPTFQNMEGKQPT